MLKSLKKKMKDQAGLTLIELLVVIVILGIIAAVALPMVTSNKDKAAKNTNLQNIAILEDAVNRYNTLNTTAITSLETLTVAESGTSNIGGKYLESLPEVKTFNGCSGSFVLSGTDVQIKNGTTNNTAACTQ
ncbi:type II secretion system protein [Bacillus coreaensis]